MVIHKKSQNKISKDKSQNLHQVSKKPLKGKKKNSSDAVKPEAVALQLEDDVPDFPRGGGSSLSRREREEIHAEVDAEFEDGERVLKKKKKGKKLQSRSSSAQDDLGSLFVDGIVGTLPRFANKITLRNISPGMKLWGVVAEVNEKDLVISLPGGLRGLVRSTDAIDPIFGSELEDVEGKIQDIFHIGQLVSCTVQRLDEDNKDNGKKKIWLSLQLSLLHKGFSFEAVQEGMILTAYIKSIEDHGYILHFGLPSFMGFLPKSKETESRYNEVRIGSVLQGVVKRIDKTRKVVYLDSDPETVSKCMMKDLQGISIDLLVPGMMVNARVQSTLENGILLSFLTYFTGTADVFHLQNAFPALGWKDDYSKNKKVNARILFVDPSTRAIGLTLNQHLVHNTAPPMNVKAGDIYENAEVVRVDRGMGLLLKVPSDPSPTPAYVSVADVAEEEVKKLEKKFKEGTSVRVRVLGFKHLEGVATGVLKASAFDGPVFTHSDVKPGMVVRAKLIAVDSFGAIVQFPGGVKALCPLRHMSEFEISKPRKKFKVGAELLFRVLGCKSKRITVTHKKTLVKSKLPILSSYIDATPGLITHGWITKIEKHGCFVHFYNGVQGFAPRSELGLEPGRDVASTYQVGQVVKCRVMSSIPGSHRINLSFTMKPSRVSQEVIKLGSVVSGVVEKLIPSGVILYVNSENYSKGIISTEHLADHHEHALLMKSVLKAGHEFDQLIVLDIQNSNLILSAKHSLIRSADQLPTDIDQISPQLVVHGYVCNLIETGCFVRYLGRLTGFSPRSKAMDDQRAQISEAFYVGQSVCSSILDVKNETSRITVSLQQSCCSSTDASFLQGYFLQEQRIAELQVSDTEGPECKWVEDFNIGNVIEGKVQELKEYGAVVSFEKYDNVFGFITQYQLGGATVEAGSDVRAVVLDIATREHLVDLSLKQEFFVKHKDVNCDSQSHKKKRKREVPDDLQLHQTVNAIVEVVKENYLVLSIPEYNHAIGYASIADYNTQKLPHKQYLNGESVAATVMALPSSSTTGRLLLLLKSLSDASSSKKAKKKSSYDLGSLVQAEITELKPLEMRVKFGIGLRGRIHITEVNDDCLEENPFGNIRIGQVVTARIVAKPGKSDNRKTHLWDLSIKPKIVTDSWKLEDNLVSDETEFSFGQCVTGYVYKVDTEWVWLAVSRKIKMQLFILDTACEPSELQEFQKRFYVGKHVTGHVLSINKEKKLLRMVLHPLSPSSTGYLGGQIRNIEGKHTLGPQDLVTAHIREGEIVGGKITKFLPGIGGLMVQIGPHMHGRIHFTELQDEWVPNPLCEYHEGQFVKCKVLEVSSSAKGTTHIDLSLRKSQCGEQSRNAEESSDNVIALSKHVEKIEDVHPGMVVQGYVKNITSKGCFIVLSRKLDAKILISNLSNGYIDKPEESFPIGKLIVGRVLSVDPLSKRVEVTLKKLTDDGTAKSEINDLSRLCVGEPVSGTIKRVESYGLFIIIDHTNLVGLCHVSQLPEDHVNIESKYRTGEKVSAKILKVDEERQRISLGMKSSNIEKDTDSIASGENSMLATSEDGSEEDEDSKMILFPNNGFHGTQDMEADYENPEFSSLTHAESRASVPPLEVNLDDVEPSNVDIIGPSQENTEETKKADMKDKKREKKRAKEEREQEIRAAEERLLKKGTPETADEFEKLVRSSPNCSFVWIEYMAFMLSLADVEKARSIAERALKMINVREENEKLNVWVAYFNLENKYGNPPQEAVKKVFQRALQYCDPEKLYLALLGMYETTKQHNLANELLDKMVKKFKDSSTVWLKRVQWHLNQEQDGVQSIVQRALLSLPRYKHIEFITQAAILEFKFGVPERGRSLFEGVLREYPKRTDIWSVYLDQEIKVGDVDLTRSLFERAISLSLPPKKMKFLFKKYLEYEKSMGDEERIESVKQKAMEYVENH